MPIHNKKMPPNKYKMSFSTGGIFYQESLTLTDLYAHTSDWNAVKTIALNDNVLQTRTESSAKRIIREIITRLQCLTQEELSLLMNGDRSEQNSLLWLAVCRNYQFIHEFAVEVIREQFLNFQYDLGYEAFDRFFYRKMEWHEALEKISDNTRKKLRQILFKMLREVDIISNDKLITPAVLSPYLISIITTSSVEDLCIFPLIDII
jgi:hypothetical protein